MIKTQSLLVNIESKDLDEVNEEDVTVYINDTLWNLYKKWGSGLEIISISQSMTSRKKENEDFYVHTILFTIMYGTKLWERDRDVYIHRW